MTVQLGGSWHLQKSSVKSNAEANGGFYGLALLHVRQSIGESSFIYLEFHYRFLQRAALS